VVRKEIERIGKCRVSFFDCIVPSSPSRNLDMYGC